MKFDLGHINRLVTVRVFIDQGVRRYACLKLRLKRSEIVFEKKETHFTDFQELLKKVGNKHPFVMHYEGKGIISREVGEEMDYRQALLMNASELDFYFTEYRSNARLFYSFMRRDVVEIERDLLNESGGQLVAVASGPFTMGMVASFLSKKTVQLEGLKLQFSEDGILGSEKNEEEGFEQVKLGENVFRSTLLPAIATAAHFFLPSEQLLVPEMDESLIKEAKERAIFRRFSMAMLLFFLTLLSANYLYLNTLNAQIVDNSDRLSLNESQLSQLAQLKEEKQRKETLLRSSGLLRNSFLSFYLMELSVSVPKTISFDRMDVRPMLNEMKDKHRIEFMEQLILLEGKSKSAQILQRWIDQLEEKEWVHTVEILSYVYEKGAGNFELQITLN